MYDAVTYQGVFKKLLEKLLIGQMFVHQAGIVETLNMPKYNPTVIRA